MALKRVTLIAAVAGMALAHPLGALHRRDDPNPSSTYDVEPSASDDNSTSNSSSAYPSESITTELPSSSAYPENDLDLEPIPSDVASSDLPEPEYIPPIYTPAPTYTYTETPTDTPTDTHAPPPPPPETTTTPCDTPTNTPASPPPPPPSSWQLCGQWSVAHGGPNNACGHDYVYSAGEKTMCCEPDCHDTCCSPAPPPPPPPKPVWQYCGEWSVAHGGPDNACGYGYVYTATDSTKCRADGGNCKNKCCAVAPTTTTETTTTTPCTTPTYTPTPPPPPPQPVWQYCGQWALTNDCPDGYDYTADNWDQCKANGSNCVKRCCSPCQTTVIPNPTTTVTVTITPTPTWHPECEPHNNEQLLAWWHDAGCTSDYPIGEGPNGWWRNHNEATTRADMKLWYKYAVQGKPVYAAACFGSLNNDYLVQWWHEAGCTTDFPADEEPTGYWHTHGEAIVKNDMAEWHRRALQGIPLYVEACFGDTPAPAANGAWTAASGPASNSGAGSS